MIKKALFLVCAVLLLASLLPIAFADDTELITLHGYDRENGYEYVEMGVYPYYSNGAFAPVLWRVLSVERDVAVLRSEYVVSAQRGSRYTNVYDMVSFDDLLQKYVLSDQAVIAAAEISVSDLVNRSYGYTGDKESDRLRVKPTPYAESKGLATSDGYTGYWTYNGSKPFYVSPNGGILNVSYARKLGVVPIITVSTEALLLDSGEGTLDNPYTSSHNVLNLFLEQKMAINPTFSAAADYGKMIPGPVLYDDAQSYYALATLSNPDHKQIKVYTGPGTEYFWHGTLNKDKVALRLLGLFGDWAWVEYKADALGYDYDVYNTGYIRTIYLRTYIDTWEKYLSFPYNSLSARMKDDMPIYDDRFRVADPLEVVTEGTEVTLLGFLDQGSKRLAYIETVIFDQLCRGFVSFDSIEIDDASLLVLMSQE